MDYINLKLVSEIEIREVWRGGCTKYSIRLHMSNGNKYYVDLLFDKESEARKHLLEEGFLDNLTNIN